MPSENLIRYPLLTVKAAFAHEHLARAKNVAKLSMFRDAYDQRRCIVPVDGL